ACVAASRAASGVSPAATNSWVRISRWNWISLRTSRGTSGTEALRRKRRFMQGSRLRGRRVQRGGHRAGVGLPAYDFRPKLSAARGGQPVVLGLAIGLAQTPLPVEPAFP